MKTVEGDRTIHRKAEKVADRDLLGWARKESKVATKANAGGAASLEPKTMHYYSKAVPSALH